jgi:hypothetical protein
MVPPLVSNSPSPRVERLAGLQGKNPASAFRTSINSGSGHGDSAITLLVERAMNERISFCSDRLSHCLEINNAKPDRNGE